MEEKKLEKILIRILREIRRMPKKKKTKKHNRIKAKELYINIQKKGKETENMGQNIKGIAEQSRICHMKNYGL